MATPKPRRPALKKKPVQRPAKLPVKRKPSSAKVNKEMVLKALTDPAFRRLLKTDPSKALGKRVSKVRQREIELVLAVLKGIDGQLKSLADTLLCANGGPCGIA